MSFLHRLSGRECIAVLQKAGFVIIRQSGLTVDEFQELV